MPKDAQGRKDDTGKLRYDLVPVGALEKLAEVYTIGARKYTDRNWEQGLKWGRVFAAMMRHGWSWWRGEKIDPVDGQHHLASVAWCAFALMTYEDTHPELDDRVSASDREPVSSEKIDQKIPTLARTFYDIFGPRMERGYDLEKNQETSKSE